MKVYIKKYVDNYRWLYVLKDKDTYITFDTIEEAKTFIDKHRKPGDLFMVVKYG